MSFEPLIKKKIQNIHKYKINFKIHELNVKGLLIHLREL